MQVQTTVSGRVLTARLSGEIDHNTAPRIREAIDDAVSAWGPTTLRLDFRDVSFMDSSGVGLVMGRYRNAKLHGCDTQVANLSRRYETIMRMSGLTKIVSFVSDRSEVKEHEKNQ